MHLLAQGDTLRRMRHDLFISFARRDNEPREVGKPGLISSFVDALCGLHRRFLPRDLVIFMDSVANHPKKRGRS